ncbi:MAG: class I SAM-dependent methyltransferase [Saprospiraceae bacterium]|nr:class I SAM-dependent methyltransferase [Saprospiraceae bacterium]MCF8251554.1 class I SAM-dependent methyltransferase [Saprospiraceae bacterium]MCF8280884.1 class I SAM-dependent methyltransferase [Bacteroidales bacterium]MCF8310936.1 class I SAM-dependent methyltransferase [Saprospiraceae bacterium]MCF8439728.1 class I SAM-dependent methyltransferase [Saprospiraceae bacterium]
MPVFQKQAAGYDSWFDRHPTLFQSELAAIRLLLPPFQKGVEIGVGTGRFAAALGIHHGLEPLDDYAEIARSRGIEVAKGVAEQMPYANARFDLALMVTVDCFLEDVPKAFAEAHRILKPGGRFIVAFLDKNGAVVKKYERSGSPSYRNAHFHSPEEIVEWLTETGFSDFRFAQTLFAEAAATAGTPLTGVGTGSFAVVLGRKTIELILKPF